MLEDIESKAFEIAKQFKRISPVFFMRKLNINFELAREICQKIRMKQYLEMREIGKRLKISVENMEI